MHLKTSLILFSAVLTAGAAEFVVTNFTGSLHEAATYENNAVPGVDDVIVWTNTAVHTLESPLTVKGVRENLANMYNDVKVYGEPLSLGEGGIVHQKGTLNFLAPLVLTTNQTWQTPAGGNNIDITTLTGPDCTLTTIGNGNLLFFGEVDLAELCCSNTATFLRKDACVSASTRLSLYPGKTLYEDLSADADLGDFLPVSATTNLNGILTFGRYNYTPQALDVTVTLNPGDRLADTIESSADRSTARLDFGGHTLENRGGEIDLRWTYAYTGAYRQYAGNAFFFYDFNAGILPESHDPPVNKRPFEFYMGGGTFTARRMEIGCATDWSRPTRAVFAGGTTLLSNDLAHAGMAVALANGPSVGTARVYTDPDGRVEVTGDAVVSTRGLWFGTYADTGAASSYSTVTNGYGEVLLTGGSLYTGIAGVRTAPARWMPTADGTNTWVTFRMAGGRLGSAPATGEAGGIYVPITLDGTNNTFACENMVGSGCSMYVHGPLLGTGGFTKTGAGALRVYGEHLATGKVTIANGTLMYYNPAVTAEVVRAETILPAATFGWTADALAGNAGTQVSSWTATNLTANTYNTFSVSPIASLGVTAPKISAQTMNGHRALAFNAADGTGVGLGGAAAKSLLGSPTSMTWAFVFRTPTNAPVFKDSGITSYANNLSAIFGRTYSGQQLAALLRTDGSIGFGIKNANDVAIPFETVWAPQRDTRFNDPHVLFLTWDGATGAFSVTMDGYTQSSTLQTGLGSFADSAITIGLLDHRMRGSAKYSPNHFTGDIAEIRYYRNTALTLEQRAQLGRELAERYGAPLYGYLTAAEKTNAVGMNAREYEIQKTARATGSLKGDHELYLGAGQRIWGSGNVNSGLTLLSGAMLDMAHDGDGLAFRNPTSYPPNTHGLTLDGGAVVRFAYHDDGVTSAPTTVSQLTVRGTNVIQIVSTDDKPAPRGVVFQADESMTIEEGAAFVLEGVGNATRLVMDAAAKTVRLETSLGTAIIFR